MNDRVPFFLNDHIAARVITEETVTSSGLIVPVNVRKGNTVHAVVCHKGVECVKGIDIGDEIVFDRNYATEIILGDTTKEALQVLSEKSIICVMKKA